MRLLIAGATGLVGRHVLAFALEDARVARVVAPTRRALPAHAKLDNPIVDYAALPDDAPWWRVDAVACALGTTIRAAGSQAAFRAVDHGFVLAVATRALAHGARSFALTSAMGADPASPLFYSRTKGETERDLAALGYPSLTLVRPALIGGEREQSRPAERAGLLLAGALAPLLPRRWRISPAPNIARALLDAALAARPGVHVVGAQALA
ncbi:MAG: NAD-dependent dehydratase [Pseudomonas sp.]|nr:NAD-dependent dehydratase [Pseudomonas sp.]